MLEPAGAESPDEVLALRQRNQRLRRRVRQLRRAGAVDSDELSYLFVMT